LHLLVGKPEATDAQKVFAVANNGTYNGLRFS